MQIIVQINFFFHVTEDTILLSPWAELLSRKEFFEDIVGEIQANNKRADTFSNQLSILHFV